MNEPKFLILNNIDETRRQEFTLGQGSLEISTRIRHGRREVLGSTGAVGVTSKTVSNRFASKAIASLVVHVPIVTSNPTPFDFMVLAELQQQFPEVPVHHGFFLGVDPVPADPSRYPLGHPLDHIIGVCCDSDPGRLAEQTQGLDDRPHFHSVVRGVPSTSRDFLGTATLFDDRAISAWSGISATGTVRKDFNEVLGLHEYYLSALLRPDS